MGIRDDEIKRLEQYARGLGIEPVYKQAKRGDTVAAEWYTDGKTIVIYKNARDSKTQIILHWIHELGHHLDFVYKNRKENKDVEYVRTKEAEDKPLTKKQRKVVYQDELNGMEYWMNIYHELDIKIPLEKLHLEMEHQKYLYHYFYLHGYDPTKKASDKKHKELKEKYLTNKKNK